MVEKYERVIDYLYPLAQTIPRKHGTFRELLEHGDYEGWRASQIAWMGHIRHADGQNGLTHLGLGISC
jgi:hypothetical protein